MDMVAYTRISLDTSGEGLGVQRQEAEIREWAEANNHTILEVLQDNDASATSGKRRPSFEKLLSHDCKNVIVWHLDRLVRVTRDLEKILDAELMVFQVTANDLSLTNATGRALARTIVAWATAEVERKTERQKSKNLQSAKDGKHYWNKGNRPFGHNLDGTLREDEATGLQEVIERILNGASIADGCRHLMAKKLPPVAGSNRGGEWTVNSLGRVLRNKRLCAIRVYTVETAPARDGKPGVKQTEEYPAKWTKIIDENTYNALQLKLATRTKTRIGINRENLLSSIAHCGLCHTNGIQGRTVGQSQYKTKTGTVATYRCSIGKHNTKKADPTDNYVRDETLMALSMPEVLETLGVETGKLEDLRKARHAEAQDWEDWKREAAEEGLRPSEYKRPRELHEDRLSVIDRELLSAEQSSVFGEDFSWLNVITQSEEERSEMWSSIPLEKRRLFVNTIWKSITLYASPQGRAGFDPATVVMVPRDDIAQHLTEENKNRHFMDQMLRQVFVTEQH